MKRKSLILVPGLMTIAALQVGSTPARASRPIVASIALTGDVPLVTGLTAAGLGITFAEPAMISSGGIAAAAGTTYLIYMDVSPFDVDRQMAIKMIRDDAAAYVADEAAGPSEFLGEMIAQARDQISLQVSSPVSDLEIAQALLAANIR